MPFDSDPANPAAAGTAQRQLGAGVETFVLVFAALLAVFCFSLASVLFALV